MRYGLYVSPGTPKSLMKYDKSRGDGMQLHRHRYYEIGTLSRDLSREGLRKTLDDIVQSLRVFPSVFETCVASRLVRF